MSAVVFEKEHAIGFTMITREVWRQYDQISKVSKRFLGELVLIQAHHDEVSRQVQRCAICIVHREKNNGSLVTPPGWSI